MAVRPRRITAIAAGGLTAAILTVAGAAAQHALTRVPEPPFPTFSHPSEEELEARENARYRVEYGNISPQPPGPPPVSTPDPAPIPTIYADPPYPSTVYTFINGWEMRMGDKDVGVYAGSITTTGVGQILVLTKGLESRETRFRPYGIPGDGGSVRIVAATSEGVLTLRSEDGSRVTFDVMSRRFS